MALAGTLARRRARRGAGAVLANWDRRLWDAALAEGLAVASAPPGG